MIIPFLDGFMAFSRVPITWLILSLNLFFFSQNYQLAQVCQEEFQTWYEDENYLYTQGQLYKQYIQKQDVNRINDMPTLGRLAFRDEQFMQRAPAMAWSGDRIAIKDWKTKVQDFMVLRAYYPPFILGLSENNSHFWASISYQFYHEGFAHLLGNLLLILIVGGFLELRYSGLLVFAIYVVGGSIAALIFSVTDQLSGAPLVGASGSLCALLGFLAISHFRQKTRLFYMILPSRNYMGFVFVPTLYWVLWLCMMEDLSGWMSQSTMFSSGVAYSIHLLGFIIGCLMALVYRAASQPALFYAKST
jgi:membrane associated rhomboid family serine protease